MAVQSHLRFPQNCLDELMNIPPKYMCKAAIVPLPYRICIYIYIIHHNKPSNSLYPTQKVFKVSFHTVANVRTDDFNIKVNVCMYLLFAKLNSSLCTIPWTANSFCHSDYVRERRANAIHLSRKRRVSLNYASRIYCINIIRFS